jgi:hypothetical protein
MDCIAILAIFASLVFSQIAVPEFFQLTRLSVSYTKSHTGIAEAIRAIPLGWLLLVHSGLLV